jgi:hypothetical protein
MPSDHGFSTAEIVSIVDGAELVRVIAERFLCVWYGGNDVEIYDLTCNTAESNFILLPMLGDIHSSKVYDIIDSHFEGVIKDA